MPGGMTPAANSIRLAGENFAASILYLLAGAAGLVWIADGDLQRYFRKRHPYVRHIRYAGQQRSEAYAQGKEAGKKIVIHRGMRDRPAERGLLLAPRR